MKTALQILKEKIKYRILNEFRRDNDYTRGYECALESVIDEIEQLLPTEREQIEKAFEEGDKSGESAITIGKLPSEYFNQTYND